ncbi:MAG: 2-hydroxychromene-2-carboxylate isomerase [Hyphomicrobiales bacterium]|nr:MAG: 2-hydroxychromene-2-carboxylate isomerase [Hyphomicrobiales bacterium]
MLQDRPYSDINYYFSLLSPWAYMGHEWFLATARNRRLPVNYKPVKLMELFSRTGGVPLKERHEARQKYRFIELQRWQMKRGIEMNMKPKFFPFDVALADKVIIASEMDPKFNPGMLILKLMRGVFCEERDMSQRDEIARILRLARLDEDALISRAQTDEIEAIYQANTDEAVEKGVFGSPTYETGGELFWGQDRIEDMNEAIEQDRTAYHVPG